MVIGKRIFQIQISAEERTFLIFKITRFVFCWDEGQNFFRQVAMIIGDLLSYERKDFLNVKHNVFHIWEDVAINTLNDITGSFLFFIFCGHDECVVNVTIMIFFDVNDISIDFEMRNCFKKLRMC